MSAQLRQQVLETIRRHRMLQPGDRVGVAVSGGADSVALLLLLEELGAALGVTLLVLHFHHGLRGAEADADEQFVAGLARARGLEFCAERAQVAAAAQRQRANLEEAARQARYAFFQRVVETGRATRVAVAHTADDQAETVLAHLLRGTGPAGLGGIHPLMGPVVRPLLEVRRPTLREYLEQRGQSWREDSTNRDTTRLRARIRHTLLPRLEEEFQPALVERLSSLAALARREEDFWRVLLDHLFQEKVRAHPAGLSISLQDFLQPFPAGLGEAGGHSREALRARLVRRIVQALRGHRRQLTGEHVEQVLRLADGQAGGLRLHLPGGVEVERTLDSQMFFSLRAGETISPPGPYEYVVELKNGSAAVTVPQIGRRYRLKVIDWPPAGSETKSLQTLDADLLRPPLVLRNWRPGDAYRPHGSRGVHKLKRLFLERRIAARERPGWPVLTSAGRLVWARGMPVAAEFAARTETRAGLVVEEESL